MKPYPLTGLGVALLSATLAATTRPAATTAQLRTALAEMAAGDTVALADGPPCFVGHFTIRTPGTFTGNKPCFDGYLVTTLQTALPATMVQYERATIALADASDATDIGLTLMVGDEMVIIEYQPMGGLVPIRRDTCTIGTPCGAHGLGDPVYALAPGVVSIEAPDVTLRAQGGQILDSGPDPRVLPFIDSQLTRVRRRPGLVIRGARAVACGWVIHDTSEGISSWESAPDSLLCSNVVYSIGLQGSDRPHGHSLYIQNNTGAKQIRGTIFGPAYGYAMQAYGSSAASINHLTFDGDVWTGLRVLAGGNGAIHDFTIKNSHLPTGLKVGYGNPDNDGVVLDGNTLVGNLDVSLTTGVTVSNNTTINPGTGENRYLVKLAGQVTDYAFSGNKYWATANDPDYRYSTFSLYNAVFANCNYFWWNPAAVGYGYCGDGLAHSWQGLGYDTTGTLTFGPAPDRVVVLPDVDTPGRVTVLVYNWSQQASVSVSAAALGLASGQVYTVHQVADYFRDVVTATYSGSGSIALAMTGHTQAVPIGADQPLQPSTFPTLGVFVLERGVVTAPTPPPPPPPSTGCPSGTRPIGGSGKCR